MTKEEALSVLPPLYMPTERRRTEEVRFSMG